MSVPTATKLDDVGVLQVLEAGALCYLVQESEKPEEDPGTVEQLQAWLLPHIN